MTVPVPPDAYPLLDEPNFAHVVTLMPDGSPQTTPVWIDRDGDTAVFNTARGRMKANNLERDPRVALSIADADNPYRYVEVRGRAELVDDGATEHIHKLSNKYFGRDYTLPEGERRVIVRVLANAVNVYG